MLTFYSFMKAVFFSLEIDNCRPEILMKMTSGTKLAKEVCALRHLLFFPFWFCLSPVLPVHLLLALRCKSDQWNTPFTLFNLIP